MLRYPYFETPEPLRFDLPGTYADENADVGHVTTYEWNHGLGETVHALPEGSERLPLMYSLGGQQPIG